MSGFPARGELAGTFGDGAVAEAYRHRPPYPVEVFDILERQRPNLRWILGAAETADLGGPYALVTAGASLHWMAWA